MVRWCGGWVVEGGGEAQESVSCSCRRFLRTNSMQTGRHSEKETDELDVKMRGRFVRAGQASLWLKRAPR